MGQKRKICFLGQLEILITLMSLVFPIKKLKRMPNYKLSDAGIRTKKHIFRTQMLNSSVSYRCAVWVSVPSLHGGGCSWAATFIQDTLCLLGWGQEPNLVSESPSFL